MSHRVPNSETVAANASRLCPPHRDSVDSVADLPPTRTGLTGLVVNEQRLTAAKSIESCLSLRHNASSIRVTQYICLCLCDSSSACQQVASLLEVGTPIPT
jgi:hypothetical protein